MVIEKCGTWYLRNKEGSQFDPEIIINVLRDIFTMEKGKRGRQKVKREEEAAGT